MKHLIRMIRQKFLQPREPMTHPVIALSPNCVLGDFPGHPMGRFAGELEFRPVQPEAAENLGKGFLQGG